MSKKSRKSFQPSRFLTDDERFDYNGIQYDKGRKKAVEILRRERFVNKTKTGRLGNFIVNSVNNVPRLNGAVRRGGRGRPSGSYDPRYAKFGGVYGFRKVQAAQLRQQRFQQLRDATITPQQQAYLAQIEARERANQQAPEAQTIPTTTGRFNLQNIHDEIDAAARIIN